MSLQTRLSALIAAMGADVKQLNMWSRPDYFGNLLPVPGPGTPLFDGQVIAYMPDISNAIGNGDVVWLLKYQQADGKWYFIGGSPVVIFGGAASNVDFSGTSYAAATGTQPSFAAPRPGEYNIRFGNENYHTTNAGLIYSGVSVNGVTPTDGDDTVVVSNPSGGNSLQINTSRTIRKTVTTAGHVIAMQYKASGATGKIRKPWLEITPRRVT